MKTTQTNISEICREREHRNVLGSNGDRNGKECDKASSNDKALPEDSSLLSELQQLQLHVLYSVRASSSFAEET